MMHPTKVLLMGDINVDTIMTVDVLPTAGRDAYGSHTVTQLGGAVCNTAIALGLLGQPCGLLGAIGCDHWESYILQELEKSHIDTTALFRLHEYYSGQTLIAVTDNGERTMFCDRGANIQLAPQMILPEHLDNVALINFSGYVFQRSPLVDACTRVLDLAQERNIPISIDTGLDPALNYPQRMRRAFPQCRILVTGPEEGEVLTGYKKIEDQAKAYLDYGIEWAAIKKGAHGAFLACAEGFFDLPVFKVCTADTTGAGDAFTAGLIYARLHGFSAFAALTIASALGAMATRTLGSARIRLPDLVRFLHEVNQSDTTHPALSNIKEILAQLEEGS